MNRYSGVVGRAYELAHKYHDGYLRKYSFLPYVTHPVEVHSILSRRFGPAGESERLSILYAAALLHDVLEDTEASEESLLKEGMPVEVVALVKEVTNPAKAEDGNRKKKAEINRNHLRDASDLAHNLKVADVISNIKRLAVVDPEYSKVYLAEKWVLLKALDKADEKLREKALSILIKNAELIGLELEGEARK